MLSLSAPFIPQFFKDQLDSVIPYTDYLIGNETEALSYAEHHGWGTTDIVEISKKLATLPKKNTSRPRIVIITQGTLPTVTAVAKENDEVEVNEYKVREIPKEKINDTNGAGYVPCHCHFVGASRTSLTRLEHSDAFAGGFTAGIVQGKTLPESIDLGQWLASLSIQELGPS